MTESINPVAVADATGLAYKEGEHAPVYILLQLAKSSDDNDKIDVDIITEGISRLQAIDVLTEVLESMKSDPGASAATVSL